jgi:hypothetical protein
MTNPKQESLPAPPAYAKRLGRFFSLPYLILYPALVLPPLFGLLLLMAVLWLTCGPRPDLPEFDPNEQVHTGEDARAKILPSGVPASANNFWLYEDGTFNGSITYWVFRCGSREDCLKAVKYLGRVSSAELKPWQPSRYAVVMEGPDFYSRFSRSTKRIRDNPWDVRTIEHGLVYEDVVKDCRWMVYFAVDLDRNLVYYHRETGGFPRDRYVSPRGRKLTQAKPN